MRQQSAPTLLTFLLLCLAAFPASNCLAESSYDIAGIFEEVSAPYGTMVLTRLGQFEEVDKVLVPKSLDIGTYEVSVTRRGSDLYEINGFGLFVQTRYCYEYGYSVDALLKCSSPSGFTKGELVFLD